MVRRWCFTAQSSAFVSSCHASGNCLPSSSQNCTSSMGRRTKSKPRLSRRAKSSSWMCRRRASPRSSLCESQWLTLVPRWMWKSFTTLSVALLLEQAVNASMLMAVNANVENTFLIFLFNFQFSIIPFSIQSAFTFMPALRSKMPNFSPPLPKALLSQTNVEKPRLRASLTRKWQ